MIDSIMEFVRNIESVYVYLGAIIVLLIVGILILVNLVENFKINRWWENFAILLVLVLIIVMLINPITLFLGIRDSKVESKKEKESVISEMKYDESALCQNKTYTSNYDMDKIIEFDKNRDKSKSIGYVYMPTANAGKGITTMINVGGSSFEADMIMKSGGALSDMSDIPGSKRSGINSVISAHREQEFFYLYDLKNGDPIIVNIDDNIIVYEVSMIKTIDVSQSGLVFESPRGDSTISFYTCFPRSGWLPVTGRQLVRAVEVESSGCE